MMSINLSSIKFRLIVMSVIGLAGFSGILFGNFSFFARSDDQLAVLQKVDLRTVQIAHELQVGLTDLDRMFEASVVEMDEDTLAEAVRIAGTQRQQIQQLISLSERQRTAATRLLGVYDAYISEQRRYADDVVMGRLRGNYIYEAFTPVLQSRTGYDESLRSLSRTINGDFNDTLQSLRDRSQETSRKQFTFAALLFLLFTLAVIWFIRIITRAIDNVIGVAGQVADGNLDVQVDIGGAEEFQRLFGALDIMRGRLKEQYEENESRQKRQSQLARLNEVLRGEKTVQSLGDDILRCMAEELGSLVGAFYLYEHDELSLKSTYAFTHRRGIRNRFGLGESLVGQAGLEQKLMVVEDLPPQYATVSSGLGEAVPTQVLLVPLMLNGKLLGVLELMAFRHYTEEEIELIRRGSDGMAIALHSALSRVELSKALEQTLRQAEVLERQQEELRTTNEELEEQAAILRASEESLQQQQEELRIMNEELEERNRLLDRQKEEIATNNAALERSRRDLQEKAKQLELSGRYKSEFLSTMSHELRTPLNSILILSQGLMDNRAQTLNPKQVEHARVINSSGRDLLMLINDILDLSKVEEGKLELMPEEIPLQDLVTKLQEQFDVQAEAKHLRFVIDIEAGMPPHLVADEQRLMQILRNFLSNAFKFTHAGQVELQIRRPATMADDDIEFAVRDTGIGIPAEKQRLIFEAFQQVDGTISRKYGGTGLGLTISRKLAELMGGSINVSSEGENQGSTFSLTLPRIMALTSDDIVTVPVIPDPPPVLLPTPAISQEPSILIVEDDPEFNRVLQGLAEEYGFTTACAHTAAEAYAYLQDHVPGSVILDLGLPDAPGQQLLAHLKSHPRTHGVPVHVISGNVSLRKSDLPGAREFIAKPFGRDRLDQLFADISRELNPFVQRGVLVIEDDPVQREQLHENFKRQNIACDMAHCGEEALSLLQKQQYGIVILDLDLPDCDGEALLETIGKQKDEFTHIIIYTARDISKKQDADLRRYADRIVLKTDQSISRLLNEATLFLHWLQRDSKPATPHEAEAEPELQQGRHILLVDDDIRNLYSLSSVLEDAGLEVTTASTGTEALQALQQNPDFDLVLMDIMMPEMDGFEAMRQIRADARFRNLPIIALTAKAMRDDRARCIEAGANDYLSKPVDSGKLKAIIKLWLQT